MSMGIQAQRAVRIHTGQSNRKAKERVESKTVFKSVLTNPFDIKWPVIPLNVQNAILARIVEMMQGVADYNHNRHKESAKKRKRRNQVGAPEGPAQPEVTSAGPSEPVITPPDILMGVTVGINEVTKRLEAQCKVPRHVLSAPQETEVDSENPPSVGKRIVRVILACRPDVDPPLLIAHIPHLVAACNSILKGPNGLVKLVPLPKGAEFALSQALGLRRVAIMALDETLSNDPSLMTLLESVPPVVAPWLVGLQSVPVQSGGIATPKRAQAAHRTLVPTHIKQLRTTAPKDMRAAKAVRAKGRAEAKAKKKTREGTKKKAEHPVAVPPATKPTTAF